MINEIFPKQSNWKKLRAEWIPSMLTCKSRKRLWKAWNYAVESFQNFGKSKYVKDCLMVWIFVNFPKYNITLYYYHKNFHYTIGQTNLRRMMQFGKEVKTVGLEEVDHLLRVWEQQVQRGDMLQSKYFAHQLSLGGNCNLL